MPPRPARFSKSTKASKPVEAVVEDAVSTTSHEQAQQARTDAVASHKRTRTCSVEVVITPTKKRRANAVHAVDVERDHLDAHSKDGQSRQLHMHCMMQKKLMQDEGAW